MLRVTSCRATVQGKEADTPPVLYMKHVAAQGMQQTAGPFLGAGHVSTNRRAFIFTGSPCPRGQAAATCSLVRMVPLVLEEALPVQAVEDHVRDGGQGAAREQVRGQSAARDAEGQVAHVHGKHRMRPARGLCSSTKQQPAMRSTRYQEQDGLGTSWA